MAVKNAQKAQEAETERKMEESMDVKKRMEEGAENKPTEGKEKETLVYIGPSLPSGKLKSNSIFIGSREMVQEELKEILEEYPLAGRLIMPVEQLAEKKDKVRTPGNILNKYYSDIVSSMVGKERKG